MMWSLVIADLVHELESNGSEVVGYADDLVLMIMAKDDRILSEWMHDIADLT